MTRPGEIGRRLRALWRRSRVAQDLDDEMQLHLALRQGTAGAGVVPRPTRPRLPPVRSSAISLRLREHVMDAWGWRWLDSGSGRPVRVPLACEEPWHLSLTAVVHARAGASAPTPPSSASSAASCFVPLPFAGPERLVLNSRNLSPPAAATHAPGGRRSPKTSTKYRRQSRLLPRRWPAFRGHLHADLCGAPRAPSGVRWTVQAERDFFSILGVSTAGAVARYRSPGGSSVKVAAIGLRPFRVTARVVTRLGSSLSPRRSAVHHHRRHAGRRSSFPTAPARCLPASLSKAAPICGSLSTCRSGRAVAWAASSDGCVPASASPQRRAS